MFLKFNNENSPVNEYQTNERLDYQTNDPGNITMTQASAVQQKMIPKLGEYMKLRPKTYFDQSKEAHEEIEKTINYLPTKLSR